MRKQIPRDYLTVLPLRTYIHASLQLEDCDGCKSFEATIPPEGGGGGQEATQLHLVEYRSVQM